MSRESTESGVWAASRRDRQRDPADEEQDAAERRDRPELGVAGHRQGVQAPREEEDAYQERPPRDRERRPRAPRRRQEAHGHQRQGMIQIVLGGREQRRGRD